MSALSMPGQIPQKPPPLGGQASCPGLFLTKAATSAGVVQAAAYVDPVLLRDHF